MQGWAATAKHRITRKKKKKNKDEKYVGKLIRKNLGVC